MACFAQCYAILHRVSQIWVSSIIFDVMRLKISSSGVTAFLTGELVSFKHALSPCLILAACHVALSNAGDSAFPIRPVFSSQILAVPVILARSAAKARRFVMRRRYKISCPALLADLLHAFDSLPTLIVCSFRSLHLCSIPCLSALYAAIPCSRFMAFTYQPKRTPAHFAFFRQAFRAPCLSVIRRNE